MSMHSMEMPSIDQIEAANRILGQEMHPLVSGLPVLAHSATWDPFSGDYTLRMDVLTNSLDDEADEWETRSYCFRISGAGEVQRSSTADLPMLNAS